MFAQCNYCEYTTTADEYGEVNAPYHLMREHDIGNNLDSEAIRDFEKHFHNLPWRRPDFLYKYESK